MKPTFITSVFTRLFSLFQSSFVIILLLAFFQMISLSGVTQKAYWLESMNNKLRSINVSTPPVSASGAIALASPATPLFIFQDERNGLVYWSEAVTGTIRKVSTSGGAVTTVVNGISGSGKYPRGIYVDVTNNILYWSQSAPGLNDEIKKISIAGSLPKTAASGTTVVSAINIVRGITVDTIANSIYFIDAALGGKGIYRASLASPTTEALSTKIAVNANGAQPNSLCLDRTNNFIYWSDFSSSGGIKRVATNSTNFPANEVPIISGVSARGLSVDAANVLYWTEYPSQKIRKANLASIPISSTSIVINGLVGFLRNLQVASPCVSAGVASVTANNNPLCPGSTANLTANGVSGTNAHINWYSGPGATGSNLGTGNSLSNVGAGTYYVYVTADCSIPAEGSITITNDNIQPTLVCPQNKQSTIFEGCSTSILVSNPSFSDNCGVQSLTYTVTGSTTLTSPTTGIRYVGTKNFAIGVSTVNYTVTDKSNNTNTCMFTVTVNDGTNPYFTSSNQNVFDSVTSNCSKDIVIPNVTFADNCGTPQLTWAMSGATVNTGNGQIGTATFNVGTTVVTYTLTDVSGNVGTSTFTVTILDTIKPTITCRANIVTSTVGTSCDRIIGSTPLPIYADNCKVKSLTWVLSGATNLSSGLTGINLLGVKTYNVGLTTVSYTVTDSSGNSETCSYTVQLNATSSCFTSLTAKSIKDNTGLENKFRARLTPNPTSLNFNLILQSDKNEMVEIVVYNNQGKKVQQLKGNPFQPIIFGEKLLKGVYLIEMWQGEKRITLTGVKQ